MKLYNILFLLTALFFTACSSPPANTANTTANITNTTANTANTANTMTAPIQSSIAASAVSPIDSLKAMNEAGRTKDTAALKRLVSKASLAMMEANAQKQNTTVDDLLSRGNTSNYEELPEMRNETITGGTATVELRDKTSENWRTMPLVMEDGVWKVAIDRFIATSMKQIPEEKKTPAGDSNKQAKTDKSKTNK